VDQYISQEIALSGPTVLASAQTANQMDFNVLPDKIANATQDGIDKVAEAIEQLKLAEKAAMDVETASVAYRPIHENVRSLQRDARTFDRAIKGINLELRGLAEDNAKVAGFKAEIEELTAEKDALLAQIPSDWDDTYKAFQEVNKAEKKAFAIYRRLSGDAYAPAIETLEILNSGDAFRALEAVVMASKSIVTDNTPADAVDPLKQLAAKFSDVNGAGDIKSAITKARRAVKSKTPDKEKALGELDKAIALYKEQLQWRAKAEAEITPKLEAYTASLRSTLGLREQKKFTREQALFVASCVSDHRDVSLNF
jgi:myosin heavy subunit